MLLSTKFFETPDYDEELSQEQEQELNQLLNDIYREPSISALTPDNFEACNKQLFLLLDYIIKLNPNNYDIFAKYKNNIVTSLKVETSEADKQGHLIDTKKSLERHLFLFQQQKDIADKTALDSYDVVHCLPGAQTNIQLIILELIGNLIVKYKKSTVLSLAKDFLNAYNLVHNENYEIHYINSLFNYVANDYSLTPQQDNLAPTLDPSLLNHFKDLCQRRICAAKLLEFIEDRIDVPKNIECSREGAKKWEILEENCQRLGLPGAKLPNILKLYTYEENDLGDRSYFGQKDFNSKKLAFISECLSQQGYIMEASFQFNNEQYINSSRGFFRIVQLEEQQEYQKLTPDELIVLLKQESLAQSIQKQLITVLISSKLSQDLQKNVIAEVSKQSLANKSLLLRELLKENYLADAIELMQKFPGLVTTTLYGISSLPIQYAAAFNRIEVIRYLANLPVDVDATDVKGQLTALQSAALHGHQEAVQLLLAYQAKPNKRNDLGLLPLHLAAMRGHNTLVQILLPLLREGTYVYCNRQHSPLYYAVKNGHTNVVMTLLENGAYPDEDVEVEGSDEEDLCLLEIALIYKHADIAALLIKARQALEEEIEEELDDLTSGIIVWFLKEGKTSALNILLAHNIIKLDYLFFPAENENLSYSMLDLAIESGQIEMVGLLLCYGINQFANIDGHNANITPLNRALQHNQLDIYFLLYQDLIVRWPAHAKTHDIWPALKKAIEFQRVDLIENLITILPHPNSTLDLDDNRLLHLDAKAGSLPIINALLKHASKNLQINRLNSATPPQTPIQLALANNHHEAVLVLLKNKAKLTLTATDYPYFKPVLCLAIANKEEIINKFITPANVNEPLDENNNTALHLAVLAGNLELIKYLTTQNRADITLANHQGQTPLQLATAAEKVDENIIEFLNEATTKLATTTTNLPLKRKYEEARNFTFFKPPVISEHEESSQMNPLKKPKHNADHCQNLRHSV